MSLALDVQRPPAVGSVVSPPVGVALAAPALGSGAMCQAGTEAMHQQITTTARLRLMGADLDPVTPDQVMAFIDRRASRGRKGVVGNHNLHSLYLTPRDPRMQAFFARADLIQIDSVPLIAWGRMLGHPVERAHRCTYLDWRDQFWSLANERGWRVFLLGSAPGVVDRMIARLKPFWPEVRFGGRDGFFDHQPRSAENRAVVQAINDFRPDVILVGMGMPLQEAWIVANEADLASGVLLSVGGAFDYEAGVQIPAPRWIGRSGLEWLFRFVVQPRRLFQRYFIEPWGLVGPAVADVRAALAVNRHEIQA